MSMSEMTNKSVLIYGIDISRIDLPAYNSLILGMTTRSITFLQSADNGSLISPALYLRDNGDNQTAGYNGIAGCVARLQAFNATNNSYDRLRVNQTHALIVDQENASFVNAQETVTNADQQFLAANARRKYLLIQNNDTAGIIYVSFGVAATAVNGVKILPGGSYEPVVPPNTSIHILGSIAANANVVVVEG